MTALVTAGQEADILDFEGVSMAVSNNAILLADNGGRYVGANGAALALLGYTLDELCTLGVADITAVDDKGIQPHLWASFTAQEEDAGYFAVKSRDGLRFVIHYHARTDVLPGVHLSQVRRATDDELRRLRIA